MVYENQRSVAGYLDYLQKYPIIPISDFLLHFILFYTLRYIESKKNAEFLHPIPTKFINELLVFLRN
jgi:hypothetical protein